MLETTEHQIGSLPSTALTYPPEEVWQYWGKKAFGDDERGRMRSNSVDLPATDRDGFARLRILQQNMINGTCGFHIWCVFTQEMSW